MTRHESGFQTEYDVREFAASAMPIDEDAAAMRALFGYMRETVVADLDAYTAGVYDAGNDLLASQALELAKLSSRNEYRPEAAGRMFDPARYVLADPVVMNRAYDVIEAIDTMNISPYQADDPGEAWEKGLDVAATARMRRELEGIRKEQRARRMGRTTLNLWSGFTTGQ